MEKYIYDKTNGWWYELVGDYYLPCVHSEDPASDHLGNYLSLQTIYADPQTIATWGMRHLTYLRKHRPTVYREFLSNGTLNSYLAEIDRTAQAMFDRLINQLAKNQDITEELKAQDEMEWVRAMNAIRHTAEEIVLSEVIYA